MAEDGVSPPGRSGLRDGLCPTREDGEAFLVVVVVFDVEAPDEDWVFGGDFRFSCAAPELAPGFTLVLPSAPSSGVNPLDNPSLPRPIIAAGVTGAIVVGFVGLIWCACSCCPSSPTFEVPSPGGAGGGIDKSTGDGVSSIAALLFFLDRARIAGVDVKLAEPRACLPL